MLIVVLGSSTGEGFPQSNSSTDIYRSARYKQFSSQTSQIRTQLSIAVADDENILSKAGLETAK